MEETPVSSEHLKNDAIYRTLNQNKDNGLVAAGFIHHINPDTVYKTLPGIKYTGFLLLGGLGSCRDSNNTEYLLTPGCFFHFFPTEQYTLEISPEMPWSACYLVFGEPLCQGLIESGILDGGTPLQQPGLNNDLPYKFEELIQQLKTSDDTELQRSIPAMINLLIQVRMLAQKNSSSNSYTDIVTRIATILATDLDKKIEIKGLLADHPLSYDRFRFIFKQELGVSPGIYRINKKMERARDLLTSRKYKVYQVAKMLGYPDAYSFSKQFSRFVGVSPKNYANLI